MEKFSEKWLEAKLKTDVNKIGGRALKFVSPGNDGVPDRLVLMPNAKVYFAELKSTGQRLGPLQRYWKRELEKMGFLHFVMNDLAGLNNFLDKLNHDLKL